MEKKIKETIKIRNLIVQNVFNFNNSNTVYVPVHFKRIIFNTKNQLKLSIEKVQFPRHKLLITSVTSAFSNRISLKLLQCVGSFHDQFH